MTDKKIIYVNFSPYDNTGRILDYLIENFSLVVHFSFDHLRLKNNRRANLSIYKNGRRLKLIKLAWLKTHPLLLFPSLPVVALVMLAETIWHSFRLRRKFGQFDYFLTVNAYPAFTGILLKKLGIVKKTTFWVWDFFPLNIPDWRMKLIRRSYLWFDHFALENSDKIVFLNHFLEKSRKKNNVKFKDKHSEIIPIGTNPANSIFQKKNVIGHMGLIKNSQGLDLLLDNLSDFFDKFPNFRIEIIGTGPEEERYKKIAKNYKEKVKFYGFMEKPKKIDDLIKRWKLGLATYIPEPWSEHYWGDPSKIKAYLSNGVPVITTKVPEFAKEIGKNKAGKVISYKKSELYTAIEEIVKNNLNYAKRALALSKKYKYKKIYNKLLD